jgi:hypothetical protein
VAKEINPQTPLDSLREMLDSEASEIDNLSWIGFARSDGTVVAGKGGVLEGTGVTSRMWFSGGLKGPFAGDVEGAQHAPGSAPARSIGMSAPIRNQDGSVYGVLGAELSLAWLRAAVTEAAARLAIDVYVINRSGTVILATAAVTGAAQGLASFQAAGLGVRKTFDETWPDGKRYFAVTMPEAGYKNLPPFGWSLVVRLDPAVEFAANARFLRDMAWMAFLVCLAYLLAFALVVSSLTNPLRVLVEAVLAVASGRPVGYFRERRRYRELAMLSQALARLQVTRIPPAAPSAGEGTTGSPPRE